MLVYDYENNHLPLWGMIIRKVSNKVLTKVRRGENHFNVSDYMFDNMKRN